MAIIVGSARIDENGNITGGAPGDQKQTSTTNDRVGEVSMQNFYVHSKGWNILRPKDKAIAAKLAQGMTIACNNPNIGYNQNTRTQVVTKGIESKTKVNSDCSALVRAVIIWATGKDVGNFRTVNEVTFLEQSGLFEKAVKYVNQTKTPVYDGDVLVTCTTGHTVIVVSGSPYPQPVPSEPIAPSSNYYPKYAGSSSSITTALNAVGEKDASMQNRKKIAAANNIANYSGTAAQNTQMLNLLKAGKLLKAAAPVTYYPKYTGTSSSIVVALGAVGEKDTSKNHRIQIATANGISGYTGTAAQNTQMISLLKSGKLIKA